MMIVTRGRARLVGLTAAAVTVSAGLVAPSTAQVPPDTAAPVNSNNMEWVANEPNLVGNALDLFERLEDDGSITRYVVAATHGNGFDIVDITDPTAPVTVGRYADPERLAGFNFHPWVQVNPRRNIVALSIENPGVALTHGISNGVEFVDISDVTNPTHLGQVAGLDGPHTIAMIGDDHVYTTLTGAASHIIDYSDPTNPEMAGHLPCAHEFFEDPNVAGRTYVGWCATRNWGILDTTDPAEPQELVRVQDTAIQFAHEVFPAPDSSIVGVADFRTGLTHAQCPGGGIHFYDISGKHIEGASLTNPRKLGAWFPPFNGLGLTPDSTAPNWGSCTMHSWQFAPERPVVVAGPYTAGTWVMDPAEATLEEGGLYDEWDHQPGAGLGPTTWGNTTGNFLAEGDFVSASQWLPFDLADPEEEELVFTVGLIRGLDVLRYTGPLSQKVARLEVDAQATGGAVSGILDRYAVLTHEGWVNKPLGGEQLTVQVDEASVEAVTDQDGSFAAQLDLPPGSHEVTVTWEGDDVFERVTVTRVVTKA